MRDNFAYMEWYDTVLSSDQERLRSSERAQA